MTNATRTYGRRLGLENLFCCRTDSCSFPGGSGGVRVDLCNSRASHASPVVSLGGMRGRGPLLNPNSSDVWVTNSNVQPKDRLSFLQSVPGHTLLPVEVCSSRERRALAGNGSQHPQPMQPDPQSIIGRPVKAEVETLNPLTQGNALASTCCFLPSCGGPATIAYTRQKPTHMPR